MANVEELDAEFIPGMQKRDKKIVKAVKDLTGVELPEDKENLNKKYYPDKK